MLYERDGRYPGTPEGEEPYEAEMTASVPEPKSPAMARTVTPSGDLLSRVVPVRSFAALSPVVPIQPPANKA
jgi:hypothetical protein